MFTGIVEALGTVLSRRGRRLRVALPPVWGATLAAGDSLCVSGCCLTLAAVSAAPTAFLADLSPETLRRTRFARLRPGDSLNLERPLRAGARLGGHFVQGHVDGVGLLRRWKPLGRGHYQLEVVLPASLLPYVAFKGSLAVEGISLTVAALEGSLASFAIVPFTARHTNLAALGAGAAVNLEADLVARYLERLLPLAAPPRAPKRPHPRARLNEAALRRQGF